MPLSPGATSRTPPLPPADPYLPDWKFDDKGNVILPNYPPYIPESQVDTSTLPRAALDGVHGTDGNMPVLEPPGSLGLSGYTEISPGVWLPDTCLRRAIPHRRGERLNFRTDLHHRQR